MDNIKIDFRISWWIGAILAWIFFGWQIGLIAVILAIDLKYHN